jgi:DNA modification methylase
MPKSNPPQYGPENPHPLSKLKTELVWEGKYDEYGNRRPVKLPASPLPLQRIETIDEPHDRKHAEAQQLGLPFGEDDFHRAAHRDDFRNMLIWGDNKLAMASLLQNYRGKIDLIYIDPPFDVGADFTMQVQLGDEGDAVQKEQSILEAVAYRDTWGKGTDSYLHMMYERLTLMRDLLSEKGSIWVHCDWRVTSYLRAMLDEMFGDGAATGTTPGFRNEVIYCYSGGGIPRNEMPRKHDNIYWYTKSEGWTFNPVYRPYSQGTIERGRTAVKGADAKLRDEGTPVNDWWPDVKRIASPTDYEKLYYDTQKSEELLERIIKMCSNEGDLVADFFCGSGTTLAVAEKLGRRWIGVDLGRYAVHTSRKRLIQVQRELHDANKPYRSFDVYNLGRYERQWWQLERLEGADENHRELVLQFYKAAPIELDRINRIDRSKKENHSNLVNPVNTLLHGKKGSAYIHVDQIDTIFEYDELRAVALAAQAAGARELHILAWEFEMELALKKQAIEAETNLKIRLKYIPREIMEPNRAEVQFFEAGALQARVIQTGLRGLTGLERQKQKKPVHLVNPAKSNLVEFDIELVNFIPSLAEAPEAELDALRKRAVKSPFDFIDFWAVDFAYRADKPFEHHWQDFRTRKDRSLRTKTDIGWKYETRGKKQICVKVIDVFGVDTTTVLEVEI